MLISFTISLILSLLLGRIIIPALKKRKVQQQERELGIGSEPIKKTTPTMGGIIMTSTILLTYILSLIFKVDVFYENIRIITMFTISTILFSLVGFIDDYLKVRRQDIDGLTPGKKMIFLSVASIVFLFFEYYVIKAPTMIYIPFLNNAIYLSPIIYILFSLIILLATTNAVNLTDGIDGLSSSVGMAILLYFLVHSTLIQRYDIAIFTVILMGAYLGFLRYNWHPSKIFMGDTGSFLLGGAIALIAISLNMHLHLLFIAIIPVIETLAVIIQVIYFKKTGKRFFKMSPYHHHLELSGWSEIKIVLVFTLITLIMGILLLIPVII